MHLWVLIALLPAAARCCLLQARVLAEAMDSDAPGEALQQSMAAWEAACAVADVQALRQRAHAGTELAAKEELKRRSKDS